MFEVSHGGSRVLHLGITSEVPFWSRQGHDGKVSYFISGLQPDLRPWGSPEAWLFLPKLPGCWDISHLPLPPDSFCSLALDSSLSRLPVPSSWLSNLLLLLLKTWQFL